VNRDGPGQPTASNVRLGRLIAGLALVLLLLTMLAASQGAVPNPARLAVLIAVLAEEGALIVGWFAAAAGFGFPLRRLLIETPGPATPAAHGPAALPGRAFVPLALQLALGVGVLLLAAALLGWVGGLNRLSGWGLMAVGWAALGGQIWRSHAHPGARRRAAPVHWAILLPAPACGLLLVAAMIAPGVLWQLPGEHMAYDVLSYHLQLPKEWLADGAIVGYHHNVYSYLPNLLEAGYLHLATLHGSAIDAGVTAQLLHAAMALLTALTIAVAVGVLCRRGLVPASDAEGNGGPAAPHPGRAAAGAAIVAAAAYLAAPWVLATGSIAFNEQAVNLLLAAALLAAIDLSDPGPLRRGLTVGLLIGAAVLVKLTAVGMVLLPLVALLLVSPGGVEPMADPGRRRAKMLLGVALAAALVLLPYLVRNAIWTGNPVFPLAADWLGSAHWSAEQVARWNAAHTPDLPLLDRLARLGTHLLGHRLFGYTLLPAGVLGLALALRRWTLRRVAAAFLVAMAAQLLFWLAATHVQSRFMVPALVPAAIGVGLLCARVRFWPTPFAVVVPPLTLAFVFYFSQANGAAAVYLDATRFVTDEHPVYGTINRLPADRGRVYAEGWATPFYARPEVTYHTVWDASPLGRLLEQHGLDGAIRRLQADGYDLLLVDHAMLNLWLQPDNYGYDPRIDRRTVEQLQQLNLPGRRLTPAVIVYDLR